MALLTKKFDVLYGWPKEGAIDYSFKVAGSATRASGDVVMLDTAGEIVVAATNTTAKPVFVVVEGNDDFSGSYVDKAVCLRSNCVVRVENYVTAGAPGTFDEGTLVTYENSTGKWAAAQTGEQVIGEVWKDERTANGTLVIYFHGGLTLKV